MGSYGLSQVLRTFQSIMAAPGGTLNCADFLMFQVKAFVLPFMLFFFNFKLILSARNLSL